MKGISINIIFLFFIFLNTKAQTTIDINFDIEFELDIENKICYKHSKKYETDTFNLSFYLIYSWPVKGSINKTENKLNIKGSLTAVDGGIPRFYPTLVIMKQPKFKIFTKCDNSNIQTYFINLIELQAKLNIKTREALIKENIGKITLSKESFLKLMKDKKSLHFEYSSFFQDISSDGLNYGIHRWYKLKEL